MRGPWRWLAAALAAALVALPPAAAWAQAAPQMTLSADAETLAAGDNVQIEMQASSAETMPSAPELSVPAGFTLRAKNASPMQTHMFVNGVQSDRYTLTADWVLQATRTGAFSLGPATVVVGNKRFASRAVKLRVVPPGQAPPRADPQSGPQSPFGFSPFDPWKQLFPGMNNPGMGAQRQAPTMPEANVDPKLAVEPARGDIVFLHASIDKTSAVVGEQVTLSLYQYVDVAPTAELSAEDLHFPDVIDFIKRPLTRDDQQPPVGFASSGGRVWQVRLIFRWAIFPLRAGDLAVGPAVLELARPHVAGQVLKRASESFVVHVSEPPLAGRPPGYALGDVGKLALAAQVVPREVEQGGAVGVHVELSGSGNLPSALTPPLREGIEWLAPDVHDAVGAIPGKDAFGGKRTFDFVVHVKRAGSVDLGEIALPFWDPELRRYAVARAALGTVQVTPNAGVQAEPDKAAEVLPGLPPLRERLEGAAVSRRHEDDSPFFWLAGVAGAPVAFGLSVGLRDLARRVAAARRERRRSPGAELKERVAAARAACRESDARAADAAIARALEAAALAHAGVNVRGAVGGEVSARLARAGVSTEEATSVATLLRECEAARFAPDETELAAARERWKRAETTIHRLERRG